MKYGLFVDIIYTPPGTVFLSAYASYLLNAYQRKFGILVSLRTQTISRTLVLVFLARAYAKSVFLTFCLRKVAFSGFFTYAEEIGRRERS